MQCGRGRRVARWLVGVPLVAVAVGVAVAGSAASVASAQTTDPSHPASNALNGAFGLLPGSHSVTFQSVDRQRRLQEQQDCTAPGHVGPLGYKPVLAHTSGPQVKPRSPQEVRRAANQAAFVHWLGGSNIPPDPHAEGGSGTGLTTGPSSSDLKGDPSVGDAGGE